MSESIDIFTETHFNWIIRHVSPDGGWPDQSGKPSSVITTAEAVIALLEAPHLKRQELIHGGVQFLIDHQNTEDLDKGAWCREGRAVGEGTLADLLRSCKAISAIALAIAAQQSPCPPDWQAACQLGIAWLHKRRCEGGGWSFLSGAEANPLATCFALATLLSAKRGLPDLDLGPIDKDFEFLEHQVNPEGKVGPDDPMQLATSVVTLLIVRLGQRNGLPHPIQPGAEQHLEEWVTSQPPDAFQPVETEIVIDKKLRSHNYPYTLMLNAAVINLYSVVAPSTWYERAWWVIRYPKFRRLRGIVRHVLRTAHRLQGKSGGFQQLRVFTWSTCMTVAAIARVGKSGMTRMPSRRGVQHWVQIALVISAIVQGACHLAGEFHPKWAESTGVKTVAEVALLATFVLGVLFSILKGTSILETLKAIMTPKSDGN